MKVELSLRFLTQINQILNGMLMDMCITHPYFDLLQQIVGALNKVISAPEKYQRII